MRWQYRRCLARGIARVDGRDAPYKWFIYHIDGGGKALKTPGSSIHVFGTSVMHL
jgi:hypothetical protein